MVHHLRILALAAAVSVTTSQLIAAQALPLGGQFQVNTYTTEDQRAPRVAMTSNGNFLVAWSSDGSAGDDTSSSSIQTRLYDASGSPLTIDFQLNTYTTSGQSRPEVTALPSGGFMTVWSAFQVRGQRLDAFGAPVGAELVGADGVVPTIDSAADGSFIVTWQTPSPNDVLAQRFDPSGNPLGSAFQVNSYTDVDEFSPRIAVRDDGRFVIAWNSQASAGSDQDSSSVQARVFEADGTPVDLQFQVNTYTTDFQFFPRIAFAPTGDFLVVWESDGSYGTDTSGNSIQGQLFDENGSPKGSEFQINTGTFSNQGDPDVATLAGGDFVVVWHRSQNTYGQLVDKQGQPLGGEFTIGEIALGVNYPLSVAADEAGRFVVSWGATSSAGNDTDGYSAQARQFLALPIFADGFESGDTTAWDTTTP